MMHRPKKRSLTLNGHRTSVSLEDEFWLEFLRIAQEQGKAINALAVERLTMRAGLRSGWPLLSACLFCLKRLGGHFPKIQAANFACGSHRHLLQHPHPFRRHMR